MDGSHVVEGQNRRTTVLKRWLSKPPTRATSLRLVTVGDPSHCLGEWGRDAIVPVLAYEIDTLTLEHAEEVGLAECRFLLCYVAEAGDVVLSKPISVRQPLSLGANPLEVAAQLDGSERSILVNQTRHHEAMMRVYISAHQCQMQASLGILDKLATRLIESDERAELAREQLHQLRADIMQLREEQQDDEKDSEVPEAQKRLLDMLERFGPLLVAKLGGGAP